MKLCSVLLDKDLNLVGDKARAFVLTNMDKSIAADNPHPCTNLARFDLVSIRLVVLCAERGSLSLAARSANMSKSNASHRLANLESNFGMQLFMRDHRGLHPTEAGSVFFSHGRAILQTIDQLGNQLASLNCKDAGGMAPMDLLRLAHGG